MVTDFCNSLKFRGGRSLPIPPRHCFDLRCSGKPYVTVCTDPIDGVKGKTWGPSTMQKDRFRPSTSAILGTAADRCCKSAPNIQKTFSHLGGHSNIGALQELGNFSVITRLLLCYMCDCVWQSDDM